MGSGGATSGRVTTMLAFLLAGLVVGFALGWGVYWYLEQEDREHWEVPQFLREFRIPDVVLERIRAVRKPPSIDHGELLERTRSMLQRDTGRTADASSKPRRLPTPEIVYTPSTERPSLRDAGRRSESAAAAEIERRPSEVSDADGHRAPTEDVYDDAILAYCLACQMRRPIHDEQRTETRTGRVAVRGVCGVCGKELFTFVKGEQGS